MLRNLCRSLLVFAILASSSYKCLCQESFDDEVVNSLGAFERLTYGLEFTKSWDKKLKVRVFVSPDGAIRKALYDETTKFGVYKRGFYSNSKEGWIFSTYTIPKSMEDPKDPQGLSSGSPHSVEFAMVDQHAASLNGNFGDYLFGFIQNKSFSKYLKESERKMVKRVIDKKEYKCCVCSHPTLPAVSFCFDDQWRLKYVEESIRKGDLIGGSKYSAALVVPSGSESIFLVGPFEYDDFKGREVVVSYSYALNTGKTKTSAHFECENYQDLEFDLESKINLPEFNLEDGQQVTGLDNSTMHYELLDGRVVLMIDSSSLAAAEKARFARSTAGHLRMYASFGIGFVLVFGFLVWYRNRGR